MSEKLLTCVSLGIMSVFSTLFYPKKKKKHQSEPERIEVVWTIELKLQADASPSPLWQQNKE